MRAAEDAQQLAAAGAGEAGDADDLAGAQLEATSRMRRPQRLADREKGRSPAGRPGGKTASRGRPAIAAMTAAGVVSAIAPAAATSPLRSTV